jgi:hypothetical protein
MTGTNLEAGTADISRHDPDFYIEDGNIVLSAKDSEKNTLYFRLHKSTLAKHSTVFQDMFDVTPTPIQSKDQYDGVPLVEMLDDANALRELIALLYDPQCVFDPNCHYTSVIYGRPGASRLFLKRKISH